MTILLADSALGLATAEHGEQFFPEDESQQQSEGLLGRKATGGEMLEQVVMGLTIAFVILSIAILIFLKALKNTIRELRRYVNSWGSSEERHWRRRDLYHISDEEQERIDLSMWKILRRWPENQQNTECRIGQIGHQAIETDIYMIRQMSNLEDANGFNGQETLD